MVLNIIGVITSNVGRTLGNVLCNGFTSDLEKEDRVQKVGLRLAHFNPVTKWALPGDVIDLHTINKYNVIDLHTGDKYCYDSTKIVRIKCAALFAGSLVVQPVGLTLNLLNKIGKIVSLAHFWHPTKEKYSFTARLGECVKDILLIIATPLILIGLIFSAFYGAVISPYNGRKLYGSFERLAYSGGYQTFAYWGCWNKLPHNSFLAPCFQPRPRAHLGGGAIDDIDVW